MTTRVTVKNYGPHRVNVNEVEIPEGERMADKQRLAQFHTLGVGEEVELHIWGAFRFLQVIETDDVDTPKPEMTNTA